MIFLLSFNDANVVQSILKNEYVLVPVHVTGTVGVTEVDQGGVYHGLLLALLQQVLQVTQVSEAASDTVPGTILVQDKHLTRGEPSL